MTDRHPPRAGRRAAAISGVMLAMLALPGVPGHAATAPASGAAASTPAPATELRFADFFAFPVGRAGLEISGALRAADGQRVRITGYMVTQEEPMRGHFFLTPRPVSMSEQADGDADDLPPATVLVLMPDADRDLPLLPTRGLLQLTGRLRVGRFELAGGRIVWVRLELEPRNSNAPSAAATP